VEGKAM
jgi:hypothetical protein